MDDPCSRGRMTRYFEDLAVGDRYTTDSATVTREDIVSFASEYDPQPIHTDEAAASTSAFGGLIASGWHTASVCMRLIVDHLHDEAWVGARGVDELRWIRPVRPGDELAVTVEVVDKRPETSLPDVGEVDLRVTGFNQDDEAVVSWIALSLLEHRP